MKRWMIGLAAATALMAAGQEALAGEEPPEGIVWYVLNELNGFYLDRDDPTNRPPLVTEVPDGVLVPVEINDDGRTDWLIAWPESAQFCGTGGCQRTLYISGETGFTRAFDRQALQFAVSRVGGEARMEAWVHHLNCRPDREECRFAWAWDDSRRELVERPSSDGVSLLNGTPEPVVDLGHDDEGRERLPPDTPLTLAEAREAGRVTCPSDWTDSGVASTWPLVRRLPDLTGDGLPDWLFAPAAACGSGTEPGFQIWATRAEGAPEPGRRALVSLAWESGSEDMVGYDVATRPATLVISTACAEWPECPSFRLAWDPATRRFAPRP